MTKLSNQPPKGTTDLIPEDFAKIKYIFSVYREVCLRFGFEEYMTPIIESAEVYRAKSGEDIGGKELWTLLDKAGREYAIRPEMTPSVTRMVTTFFEKSPKPIKLFSIANFMRNEKPQKGRAREFWQLNYDIFGSTSIYADIEILQIALEIMLTFGPPKDSFTLYLNHRKLIDYILSDIAKLTDQIKTSVVRILDKWEKLESSEFDSRLKELGLKTSQIDNLRKFMNCHNESELLKNFPDIYTNQSFKEISEVTAILKSLGYSDWIKFQPSIIRGFDYYDGIVFEVFDNSPDNNRSMFGGGRYNGLSSLFTKNEIPATGAAPGELTMKLFLENWKLFDKDKLGDQRPKIYIPLIDEETVNETILLASRLRDDPTKIVQQGNSVEKLSKALEYADKKGFDFVVIYGSQEKAKGVYKLKNLIIGAESEVRL